MSDVNGGGNLKDTWNLDEAFQGQNRLTGKQQLSLLPITGRPPSNSGVLRSAWEN